MANNTQTQNAQPNYQQPNGQQQAPHPQQQSQCQQQMQPQVLHQHLHKHEDGFSWGKAALCVGAGFLLGLFMQDNSQPQPPQNRGFFG